MKAASYRIMADSPGGCQSLRDIEEARRAIAAMSGIGLPRTRARLRGHVAENSPSPRDPVSEGPTHLQNNPCHKALPRHMWWGIFVGRSAGNPKSLASNEVQTPLHHQWKVRAPPGGSRQWVTAQMRL